MLYQIPLINNIIEDDSSKKQEIKKTKEKNITSPIKKNGDAMLTLKIKKSQTQMERKKDVRPIITIKKLLNHLLNHVEELEKSLSK